MLLPELSFSKNGQLKSPHAWTSQVRSSPRAWKKEDAELIESYLLKQIKSPQYFVISTKIDNIIPRKPSKNFIQNRVGRLNRRTKKGDFNLEKDFQKKRVLSRNKVTGYAVNFPIQKTCRPTKVCRDTCYFAAGLNATSPALTSSTAEAPT